MSIKMRVSLGAKNADGSIQQIADSFIRRDGSSDRCQEIGNICNQFENIPSFIIDDRFGVCKREPTSMMRAHILPILPAFGPLPEQGQGVTLLETQLVVSGSCISVQSSSHWRVVGVTRRCQ